MLFKIKSAFLIALFASLLLGCSSPVVDQYIQEIERTTKEIKAATSIEMITAATERLMQFEREHYDALHDELDDDKMKQASVNRAYEEFMKAGMSRTFELAGATVRDSVPQVEEPIHLPAVE
jgi:PBP1b-binding outer membrane lipoprotein LpoB